MQLHFRSKQNEGARSVGDVRGTSWRRVSRDPFVDWVLMIVIALAILAILVVIGVSAYIDVGVASTYVPEQSVSKLKQPIDSAELNRVVQAFDKRAEVKPTVTSSDPSL